ncbi:unnamed protein product [Clavelina lepadiformis]|uniref:F-box domain-containing protein n=1 Tax=Clavelina lepadiformis TaxID=159417 RepID=A0ABP0F8Z7_CLALP
MNFNELYYQKSQKRETRIQWIMDECEQKQLYDDLGIIGEISPDAGSSVLFERDENNKTKECNVLQNYHQVNIETPATNTSVKIKRKHALNRFQRKRCRPTTKVIGNMYHAKIGKMDISSEPETASTHVHKKRALDSSVVGKLPDEVFLKIFRYCSSDTRVLCSHVCWRWYHMINDESLWRQISLARKAITIHEVQRLLKRNMQVLCLNCAIIKPNSSGELNTSTASFKEGFSASPRADPFSRTYHYPVHSLDFTNANISPNLLCLILMRCNNLQNLSLEGLTISHNVLGSLSGCKQLQRLNLCLCHEMTTSGVIQLLTACTKILELNLGWTNLCQFDPGQVWGVVMCNGRSLTQSWRDPMIFFRVIKLCNTVITVSYFE